MRISAINYNYTQNCTRPNFQAHYDNLSNDKNSILERGDGIRYEIGTIKNFTTLFRDNRFYKQLPLMLKDKFPQGAIIYDYACSAGYEPASIIMSLDDTLGSNEAKKYLPILAYDKNIKIINLAQKNKIKLNKDELDFLYNYFPNINPAKYLTRIKKDPFKLFPQTIYKMKKPITDNIIFNQGDLFTDLKDKKFTQKPCVVFFRNAWQYLTKFGTDELANLLYENLPSKSIVVIGDYDDIKDTTTPALLRAGFTKIEDNYKIPYKYVTDEKKVVGCSLDTISDFCFEKP